MRLKNTPADFIVREATDLRIRKNPSPHRIYTLEKEDWNTADALMRIAREHRVPYSRFGYGGKKDRHAHTYQYVTFTGNKDVSVEAKGYSLKFLGYSQEPMTPSRILANHFEITIRAMTPEEERRVAAGASRIEVDGLPNYFDDQRFGNVDKERGFVAEKGLQGRWEEALNLALTTIHPEEHTEAKRRKRALREHWGDWSACRELAHTAFEQRSFDLLKANPVAFREALATVNRETAMLWVSAYQSWLWNESMRRLLKERGWEGPSHAGVAGPYLFLAADANPPEDLVIPLPGRGMRFSDRESGFILEEVLRERRLRPATLDEPLWPGLEFKASPRPAFIKPQGLWRDSAEPDERYPDHVKVLLRFTLPRGSYATMVVKAMGAT